MLSATPIRVRPAQPADLPAIMELVRALAEFERLPPPDAGAAARMETHAFGTAPCVAFLVADDAAAVVGYAAWFMAYSTFLARPSLYLEDLFVSPGHRRRGIGRAFLRELARVAVARGCGRFDWTVLDWNAPAQEFYASLGARVLPDWRVCRLEGEALAAFAATP